MGVEMDQGPSSSRLEEFERGDGPGDPPLTPERGVPGKLGASGLTGQGNATGLMVHVGGAVVGEKGYRGLR
jgi:hypothetical protein